MSRAPVIAFALAALFSAFGAQAASPTQLRHVTLDYDPAVFELVADAPNRVGAAMLRARDGVAYVSLDEFPALDGVDDAILVAGLEADETVASPPYPISEGPAGWTCKFVDVSPQGMRPVSLMRCAGRNGQNAALLRVMTSATETSPEMFETLRTMIASIRFKAAD